MKALDGQPGLNFVSELLRLDLVARVPSTGNIADVLTDGIAVKFMPKDFVFWQESQFTVCLVVFVCFLLLLVWLVWLFAVFHGIVTAAGLCTGPIPVRFCGPQLYALIR